MRQRNDSGSALHVSAWPTEQDPGREPFDVAAGEETDFPQLLAGFTSLEPAEPEPTAAPDAQDSAPAAKARTRGKAATGAEIEGGEAR